MTDVLSSDEELINRYLAGSLTDAEALVIETRIVDYPTFRGEVELTVALKEGFRELEKRQELSSLLAAQSEAWSQWRLFAIAATALIAVAGLSWMVIEDHEDGSHDAIQTSELYFEHTRGSALEGESVWQRSGAPARLRLHLDVGATPAPNYEVSISNAEHNRSGLVFSSIETTEVEGEVVADIDGAILKPGRYRITLTPLEGVDNVQPITYQLTVK